MAKLRSVIRPAPAPDGPYFVVTENNGVVSNVTLGLANLNTALDQVKTDQSAILTGPPVLAVSSVIINTEAS